MEATDRPNVSVEAEKIDTTENGSGVDDRRLVLWFVRGTDDDGKRWESGHRHSHREGAKDEIERWKAIGKTGAMQIMREVFPQNSQDRASA